MKASCFFFLFIALFPAAYSQSYGVSIEPDWIFYDDVPDGQLGGTLQFDYAVGIFHKHQIKSGINFSGFHESGNYGGVCLMIWADVDIALECVECLCPDRTKSTYIQTGVPVLFYIGNEMNKKTKTDFYILAGYQLSVPIINKTKSYYSNGDIHNGIYNRDIMFGATNEIILGLSFQIPVKEKYSITIEPVWRAILINPSESELLNFMGMNAGFRFSDN
jgi:hypothetical protein